MAPSAPELPQSRPTVQHDGRSYPLTQEPAGWRMRSRSKVRPVDFRTGTHNLNEARRRAKDWLTRNADSSLLSRRGGGSLEALAAVYLATAKRTKDNVARDNASRLRTVCRAAFGRELDAVTCREVGPKLWTDYQRAALAARGHAYDLTTRRRENIAINAAVRCARCLFLPPMLRAYRAAGLDVRSDAGEAVMLPMPYVPPSGADDVALLAAWAALETADRRLWLTIGLARFAGLRREEIAHCRVSWIEGGTIALRDRPDEQWWSKTGKPYRAQIIEPALVEYLAAIEGPPDALVVPDPAMERSRWFAREPQKWLKAHGVTGGKPLHRLRGLYADHIAALTQDAVTARLAAIRAAQENLGHTSSETTQAHYLTPGALR